MKGTSEGSARPVTASNAANGTGTIPYRLPRRTENTNAQAAVDEAVAAHEVFARLAPMLAARRSMRLWNPSLDRYNDRARTLTRKLPDQPAAVPIYRDGRTRLLALDFDGNRDGPVAVDRDVERCLGWIQEAGGRAITDHSTSGGRHILVPLPLGDTLDLAHAESLVRALAARLPSLDITPMLNPATGCITPPGSRCKQGGYRRLDGSIDNALDAITTRSAPGFVARLRQLVAGTAHEVTIARGACAIPRAPRTGDEIARDVQLWEGEGERVRLRAEYRRRSPLSPAIESFARDGATSGDGRWTTRAGRLDRSAARQSVLAAAIVRGYCYLDVREQLPAAGGNWRGFADAYRRYGRGAEDAMYRDWSSARRWAEHTVAGFLSAAHKRKDTGGHQGGRLGWEWRRTCRSGGWRPRRCGCTRSGPGPHGGGRCWQCCRHWRGRPQSEGRSRAVCPSSSSVAGHCHWPRVTYPNPPCGASCGTYATCPAHRSCAPGPAADSRPTATPWSPRTTATEPSTRTQPN
jgi:hypothetical protein